MQLVKYEAACRAVAEATRADEAKDIIDKSKAIEAYGRQAKNRDIEADGFEIRMRAERRLGEILKSAPVARGGGDTSTGSRKVPVQEPPTLADLGIDKKLSSNSKKSASLPSDEFEERIAVGRDKIKAAVKSAHVANNSGEDEWYTPPEYIESARLIMGSIDLDPASHKTANKIVQAGKYYTKKDDGLSNEWRGNIWLNPPYSKTLIVKFCDKLISDLPDIKQAVVLVNNATDTDWFQAIATEAQAICLVNKRIKFIDKNGVPCGAPLQGQAILYFGKKISNFRKEFSKYGVTVKRGI